nr:hypothetical protein Itr_chr14CG00450 [Ipomoea trifida]
MAGPGAGAESTGKPISGAETGGEGKLMSPMAGPGAEAGVDNDAGGKLISLVVGAGAGDEVMVMNWPGLVASVWNKQEVMTAKTRIAKAPARLAMAENRVEVAGEKRK